MHWTPQHGLAHRMTELLFRPTFELFKEKYNDVEKTHLPTVDQRLLVHQFAAQQAFDGPHQAPADGLFLGCFQVGLQGCCTELDVFMVGGEKKRGWKR